jgi:hypothetical protein
VLVLTAREDLAILRQVKRVLGWTTVGRLSDIESPS